MMRLTTLALWAALAPHALSQEVHFSPEERLASIDAGLLGAARRSIGFASYTLTDPLVLGGTRFEAHFETMWTATEPMIELPPAEALEP